MLLSGAGWNDVARQAELCLLVQHYTEPGCTLLSYHTPLPALHLVYLRLHLCLCLHSAHNGP